MRQLREETRDGTATVKSVPDPASFQECFLRIAVQAAAEGDLDFLQACERRWLRSFAPDGPTLVEVIAGSLDQLLPGPDVTLSAR